MLNAKGLGDLFTKNRDGRLCKRWYLMTFNGTLLAYSRPVDIRELRKRVAIAAMTWHELEGSPPSASDSPNDNNAPTRQFRPLHLLIQESEMENLLMCEIQGQLLLVLEGGVPPRKRGFEQRTTAEGPDGVVYPTATSKVAEPGLDVSVSSLAESTRSSSTGSSVLTHHRKKLEAMASAINNDFESKGFRMPEQIAARYF